MDRSQIEGILLASLIPPVSGQVLPAGPREMPSLSRESLGFLLSARPRHQSSENHERRNLEPVPSDLWSLGRAANTIKFDHQ